MKSVLIFILCCCLSCSYKYATNLSEGEEILYMKKNYVIHDTLCLSNQFRMLCNDLWKESDGNLSKENYTPSDSLIRKYNLRYSDGKYYVKGYLHTQPDFNENEAKKANISIVSYTDMLKSFSCLISQIPELVTLPNISTIELSKSVKLKLPKKH